MTHFFNTYVENHLLNVFYMAFCVASCLLVDVSWWGLKKCEMINVSLWVQTNKVYNHLKLTCHGDNTRTWIASSWNNLPWAWSLKVMHILIFCIHLYKFTTLFYDDLLMVDNIENNLCHCLWSFYISTVPHYIFLPSSFSHQ